MIKFFRRIRRKLLDEGNLKRYLIYAIGEIVLVVIGILIALQVNDWNENRKQKLEEQRILVNLKTDIEKDTSVLNQHIRETIKRDSAIVEIIDLLAPEKGYDKKRFINLSLYNVAFDNFFEVNSGTFDESIASGSIKYISSDTLRQKIFDYYRDTKLNLNDRGMYEQGYNRTLPIFFEKVMTSKDLMELFGSESRLPEIDLNALGKDVKFMSILAEKLAGNGQKRKSWNRYLQEAKELLIVIDKEFTLE